MLNVPNLEPAFDAIRDALERDGIAHDGNVPGVPSRARRAAFAALVAEGVLTVRRAYVLRASGPVGELAEVVRAVRARLAKAGPPGATVGALATATGLHHRMVTRALESLRLERQARREQHGARVYWRLTAAARRRVVRGEVA